MSKSLKLTDVGLSNHPCGHDPTKLAFEARKSSARVYLLLPLAIFAADLHDLVSASNVLRSQ
jgi:hypothetical protein